MIDFEYQAYNIKQGLTNYGLQYHVDWEHGDDGNDGRDWAHATATIEQARALQNAQVNWGVNTPMRYSIIWVRPGIYVPAAQLFGPSYCHLIGLGDLSQAGEGVAIRASGMPALAGQMCGTHVANIAFSVDDVSDIFDMNMGGSSMHGVLIEHCQFLVQGAVDPVCGIDCETANSLIIRDCLIGLALAGGALENGIVFRGGADQYCNGVHLYRNRIFAKVRGILLEDGCVGNQSVFEENTITAAPQLGAQIPEGIEIVPATDVYIVNNFISAIDAINHASGANYLIGNRIVQATVGAWET